MTEHYQDSKENQRKEFDSIKRAISTLKKDIETWNMDTKKSTKVESSRELEDDPTWMLWRFGFPEYYKDAPKIDCNPEFDKLNIDFRKLWYVQKKRTLNGMWEKIEQTEFIFDTNLEKTDAQWNKYIEINGTRFDYVDFDKLDDMKLSTWEVRFFYTKRDRVLYGREGHSVGVYACKWVDVMENGKIKHKVVNSGILMNHSAVDRVRDEVKMDTTWRRRTSLRSGKSKLWSGTVDPI